MGLIAGLVCLIVIVFGGISAIRGSGVASIHQGARTTGTIIVWRDTLPETQRLTVIRLRLIPVNLNIQEQPPYIVNLDAPQAQSAWSDEWGQLADCYWLVERSAPFATPTGGITDRELRTSLVGCRPWR